MNKFLPKPPTITVVVRNLPIETNEEELRNICATCGGVAEVEIPAKVSSYTKFMYAFVRFVSLEAALTAISKLDGLMVQKRRLNVQLARNHYRNTNEKTVIQDEIVNEDKEKEASDLSEEEMNATIMQTCYEQWQQHRRRNQNTDLPSFGKILKIILQATKEEVELKDEIYESESGTDNCINSSV
ncbi:sex-lethal homolog [Palaemon carinicauda]|uniref:sex-lethal homolog n=1 Tax=Palaemon carinicauda TaxID=392227 RepID=UPI0035B6986B